MSETFKQVKFTEQHTQGLDNEIREFEAGETVSIEENLARFVVQHTDCAEYTDKQHEVEDADSKVIRAEFDGETGDRDEFDFETYVDEHTASEIVEEVEESDSVTWLENLENHSDYKTVNEAINERLDQLE